MAFVYLPIVINLKIDKEKAKKNTASQHVTSSRELEGTDKSMKTTTSNILMCRLNDAEWNNNDKKTALSSCDNIYNKTLRKSDNCDNECTSQEELNIFSSD